MLSTTIFVAVFLGLTVLQISLWAVFLRFGLRWNRVADATVRRTVVATISAWGISLALLALSFLPSVSSNSRMILLGGVGLASCVASIATISQVFKVGVLRSFLVWLPTLVLSVAMSLFAEFVVRPFIYEAFVGSANAMAPTILGEHLQSTCPNCGGISFCLPGSARRQPDMMICGNFHINKVTDLNPDVIAADKFLVAKFLAPKRWDVVVFQNPADQSRRSFSRVVGMPGETIQIEDGEVFVNGNKQILPDSLQGIKFESDFPGQYFTVWGSKNRPAVLNGDEYFVLGDFTTNSNDSRFWEAGAPGHNPFAVPESHLCGVVTHIYWPLERCRILR